MLGLTIMLEGILHWISHWFTFVAGGSGVRPTLQQFDLHVVTSKLSGQVVHMRQPKVISSTAIQLNWEVSSRLGVEVNKKAFQWNTNRPFADNLFFPVNKFEPVQENGGPCVVRSKLNMFEPVSGWGESPVPGLPPPPLVNRKTD